MKKSKQLIAAVLAATSVLSMTGCSTSMLKDDATSYPLVPQLTISEVREYYANALSYDSVVSKNLDVDTTRYEVKPVTDEATLTKLRQAQKDTEKALQEMTYEYTPEKAQLLDEETFHYIKSYLNDRQISDGVQTAINQALGYYFIDVEYNVSASKVGSFTNTASLLGLNGALKHSEYYNTDTIDSGYMKKAAELLNEYYEENRIEGKKATFDESTGFFTTDPNVTAAALDFTSSTMTDTNQTPVATQTPVTDENTSEGGEVVDGETTEGTSDVEAPVVENNYSQSSVETSQVLSIRSPKIDIDEFNTVVGSSIKQSAYMPKLDMVYNIPTQSEGQTISGIGIMPSGIGGLAKFGFNRSQMSGKLTMRYVYKDSLENPGEIIGINIYPVFCDMTTGFSENNDNIVADFLMEEFEKLIDRADRAIVNCDLPALMSGEIFADMGMAVLRGYENNHVNVLRQMSTIRRVISRDVADGRYLIEIETQRQEGPKGADVYGTYRDKAYVAIEQQGQSFVITDYMVMTRQMQTEPEINPDSAVSKRLVALNLVGEVSSTTKEEVAGLLSNLYTAETARILNGPKDVTVNGQTVTIQKGMYDCFNSNTEMLSSVKNEEINSKIRTILVKHGTSVACTARGIVTEWIGGADNQVEFMTEEIYTYQGRSDGVYVTAYYLVSKMEDEWVIDDMQIITMEEHSGTQLESDIARIQ